MDSDVMRTALKGCELFKGLDQDQMDLLMMSANSREFSAGETVYERGEESGGTFALIGSGRINVVAKDGFVLNELGAGEIIGEVGVISQHDKRTVTITTIEPTEILEWHIQDIEEKFPEVLQRLKDLGWKRIKYWNE
ncbi:MAG: cyclic nucleotide-binding domain-containing protein [Deltaproteobacteria bacterium]|nr:cyclic nucleotide-binding domain-containing protein [Deltaproteobacteria bacterium]